MVRRELSGIYFRGKNQETGKFENIVFEELSEEEQDKQMEGRSVEWLKSMCKQLGKTIVELGEASGLSRNVGQEG